jgi:hypothetical protein
MKEARGAKKGVRVESIMMGFERLLYSIEYVIWNIK